MSLPNRTLMRHYGTERVFLEKEAGAAPLLARLGMGVLNYEMARRSAERDEQQRAEDALRYEAQREYELAKMRPATENLRHTRAPLLVPANSSMPVGWDEGMVRLASIAADTGADFAKEAGIGDMLIAAKSFAAPLASKAKNLFGGGLKAVGAAAPKAGLAKTIAAAPIPEAFHAASSAAPKTPGLLEQGKNLLQQGKQKLTGGLGWKANAALVGGTLAAGVLGSKAISGASRAMSREPAGPATYGQGTTSGFGGQPGYQLASTVNQYGEPVVGPPIA